MGHADPHQVDRRRVPSDEGQAERPLERLVVENHWLAVGGRPNVELHAVDAGQLAIVDEGVRRVLDPAAVIAAVRQNERAPKGTAGAESGGVLVLHADSSAAMGIAKENVAPAPSSLCTQTRPLWPSTTWRTMDSPRPVPPPRTRARSTL